MLTVRGFDGESQTAASGQEGAVCLFKSTKAGQTTDLRLHYGLIGSVDAAGDAGPRIHWWASALATSVKESFPDWRDRSKTMVFELVAVKK